LRVSVSAIYAVTCRSWGKYRAFAYAFEAPILLIHHGTPI